MAEESFLGQVKRLIVGAPIPSHLAHHERFSRVTGLAVLSSDPLSSVAYATEEILRVLTVGGVAALSLVTPIGAVIATMLAIVVFSYRQTIHAYPSGGGAYIVAKENLGRLPALVAAASLLIDYVLTVAVSIAAGVAAITSALPHWHVEPRLVCLGFVAILMFGNLRGIRESGRLFAGPTYFFIVSILADDRRRRLALLHRHTRAGSRDRAPAAARHARALPLFVLLTAFSNGCTAMTGVEAVSNGVPAFRPPESRNAAQTLVAMAVMAITMFMGITLLAHAYAIVPNDTETVVSQIARATFGGRGWPYYARAGGDDGDPGAGGEHGVRRLPAAGVDRRARPIPAAPVHESGRSAGVLERHPHSERARVGPAGRVRRRHARADPALHDRRVRVVHAVAGGHGAPLADARGPGWRTSALINGFGAIVTGIVLIIVATTKAAEGAWIIIVMIPVLVTIFEITRRHYDHVAAELTLRGWRPGAAGPPRRARADWRHSARRRQSAALRADAVQRRARGLRRDRSRSHRGDAQSVAGMGAGRRARRPRLTLPVADGAAARYIEQTAAARIRSATSRSSCPSSCPTRIWQHLLHNQHALLIKGALLFKPNVVVTSVPFHLGLAADALASAPGRREEPIVNVAP